MACVRSGISGWVIGLLIGRRAVAERRAPMLADSEARRCFLFGTLRSAVAELFANRRSAAAGVAGQAFGCAAHSVGFLASAERDRSLNLELGKGGRVFLCSRFLVRARAAPGQRFRSGRTPARSYGDCSARADRNRWPRGGCGVVCALAFQAG